MAAMVLASAAIAFGQANPGASVGAQANGPANVAGLLYAANFAHWTVSPTKLGTAWTSPEQCFGTSGGVTFPLFSTTAPVTIVDVGVPANTETVTPSSVSYLGSGCSVSLPSTHAHSNYYLQSGTLGLQEAANYAGAARAIIVVTPDWSAMGGTTYMIQSATLGALTAVSDQRSALNPVSQPTTTFYMDGKRTDLYTQNGTIQQPYKTLDQLSSALNAYVTAGGAGPVAIWSTPSASYSTANAITLPAIPIIVYGNNSTWTFSAGVTNNALPFIRYDLNTVGTVTHGTCASTIRSESHGGSYLGNVTLGSGCYDHLYGVNLSGNSYTLTVNGLLYGEALTGSMRIASGGSSSILALYNPNLIKSSGYNVDMTAGGQLLINGGLLTTVGGTANVYLPTANATTSAHSISGLITPTGSGISCVNGTTTYLALGESLATQTYCTLIPVSIGSMSIPALKSTTGTLYLCIGTTGTITSSASACSGT
jgi:hypothetical protein